MAGKISIWLWFALATIMNRALSGGRYRFRASVFLDSGMAQVDFA